MPETQAEVIAGRYANELVVAGWSTGIRTTHNPGKRNGDAWLEPASVSCWVDAIRDPGSQAISFGWETVTDGAPGTTHYLGGYLNQPEHARAAERHLNLRTLRVLNEIIQGLTR